MTVLVACFGNVLRADDGAGIAVGEELVRSQTPLDAQVIEIGIGGIRLVQELMSVPVRFLIVVDAVDLGRPEGTVITQIPEIMDVSVLSPDRRRDELADMHLATPARALMMARGLQVLPPRTVLVGIQSTDTDEPRHGLSDSALAAVPHAVAEVRRLVAEHHGTGG